MFRQGPEGPAAGPAWHFHAERILIAAETGFQSASAGPAQNGNKSSGAESAGSSDECPTAQSPSAARNSTPAGRSRRGTAFSPERVIGRDAILGKTIHLGFRPCTQVEANDLRGY